MARIDTLGNFLTDVATAIRNKKGTTDTIAASDFDTEIDSIETGGGSTVTKGIIINECDENGYATDVSVVGMTSIPDYYFAAYNDTNKNALNKYVKNIQLPSGITSIGAYAFQYCTNLALTELPAGITSIENEAFYNCKSLTEMTCLGNITTIKSNAFAYCAELSKFALPNITSVPTLSSTNVFGNTPIASGTGYIYVPDDLVESFKSATNWSTYADQIKAISEMGASA